MQNKSFKKEKHIKNVEEISTKDINKEWNIKTIRADKVEKIPYQNDKVKIALIDSGIDYTDDIDVVERKNFIPGEDNVSILYDDASGHGTSIAGIIAAKDNKEGITGINPYVEIYSAKVLDSKNYAPISRVVEAIYWAIEKEVDIISISFGTTIESESLRLSIQDAYNAGILIIAAAGNNETIEYPATYNEVMAIGSVNSLGDRSENSAIGNDIELVAPGEQILSTGSFGGLSVSGGTSMAVPHVVGVASVLWQKDLTCSSNFIRQLLNLSANKYGNSNEYGYGLVDLSYALKLYDEFKKVYIDDETFTDMIENVKESGGLADNTSNIVVFNDVEYVEGSWTRDDHAFLVVNGNANFSTISLAIIKQGARANDNYYSGMLLNPQWHGYWKKVENGVKIYECNYISSYIYLTQVAIRFGNGIYSDPARQSTMPIDDYNAMIGLITSSGFNGTSWSTLLSGYTVNNYNKKLFIYGMSLHTATDVFAHCTYQINGTYINHENGADDTLTYPNRFSCASIIAKNVVYNCWLSQEGNISDYILNIYNGSFKVKNLSSNAAYCNITYYTSHKSFFDNMNIY